MDTIYWHMNATQGGANLHPDVNSHPGANLHPGANCAYEHGLSLKPQSCAQFAQGANLHPGCIFGHVNGVLRICTRMQICSCLRGGANLFASGCKLAPGCKLCT